MTIENYISAHLLGFIPPILMSLLLWRTDRWKKAPFVVIVLAFTWGAVPSIVWVVSSGIALYAPSETDWGSFFNTVVLAPFNEELIKGIGFVLLWKIFNREIHSLLDGVILSAVIGLGFSASEDAAYFMAAAQDGVLIELFIVRSILGGLLHSIFTTFFGVSLVLASFSKTPHLKWILPSIGLGTGTTCHAFHNLLSTTGIGLVFLGYIFGVVIFIATIVLCLHFDGRTIRRHLKSEVQKGTIFKSQADAAASFWKRSLVMLFSLGITGYHERHRLLEKAAKLALLKDRAEKRGETTLENEIEELRRLVRKYSRQDFLNHENGRTDANPPLSAVFLQGPPKLPTRV